MANFRGVLVRCTDGLKHVDVPEGVEEIWFMAFAECTSLKAVTLLGDAKICPTAISDCGKARVVRVNGES